jgi:hypothetical protein
MAREHFRRRPRPWSIGVDGERMQAGWLSGVLTPSAARGPQIGFLIANDVEDGMRLSARLRRRSS